MYRSLLSSPISAFCLASILICLTTLPGEAASVTWSAIKEAANATPEVDHYQVKSGEFTLASDVANLPVVTCRWATAIDSEGRPAPRADDLVYYFHQPNHHNFINDSLSLDLVRKSGFSVCGVVFTGPSTNVAILDDRKNFYAYSHSGSLSTIFRAITKVREQLQIPQKPLFLYGYSAGGIGVQHLAEEYPNLCDGVVSYCGHFFVQKNKANCPFIIAHNYGDLEDLGLGVTRYYQNLGVPVIRLIFQPQWSAVEQNGSDGYHRINPDIFRLTRRFFEALADMRRANPNKVIAESATWPLVISSNDFHCLLPTSTPNYEAEIQKTDGASMFLPSNLVAAEVARQIAPPKVLTDAVGEKALIAQPTAIEPVRGVLLVHDNTNYENLTADSASRLRQQTSDLRYAASRHYLTILSNSKIHHQKLMTEVHVINPATAELETAGLAFFPRQEDLLAMLPHVTSLVIISSPHQTVAELQNLLKTLHEHRVSTRLILLTATDEEFTLRSDILASSNIIFFRCASEGREANNVALHQKLLRIAMDALEYKEPKLPVPPAP